MLTLPPDAVPDLRAWFTPERPGPLLFEHVARTGHGCCRVDRWPDPRVVLVELPGNYALRGDPTQLAAGDLADVAGFVEAPPEWVPALRAQDPATMPWDRVIAVLPDAAVPPPPPPEVRQLTSADAAAFASLSADSAWISETWGEDGSALLAAGMARGVLVDGHVASVAVPFFVGTRYEDIGVVTEPAYRERGLSTACAGALVADIRARGHIPTWTTSPDNTASLAVAARLGFTHVRDDVLYAVRAAIPT